MKIAVAADHRGFAKKQYLMQSIDNSTIMWIDAGCSNDRRCDYPEFAIAVARKVQSKEVEAGVLLCATGIGMAIAANRFKGVYAALAWNQEIARLSKEHDNANILVIPSDYVSNQELLAMVTVWLQATFLEGRYQERMSMIDKLITEPE